MRIKFVKSKKYIKNNKKEIDFIAYYKTFIIFALILVYIDQCIILLCLTIKY